MDFTVNGRFLNRPTTGVERYGGEVLRRLDNRARVVRPGRVWTSALGHVWEQAVLPARLRGDGILWSPANTGPLLVRRQVLTLHDIAPLDHPEWFRPGFARWYGWLLPRLVHRVRRVLTDSEFSRGRITDRIAVAADKIDLAPPGVGPPFGSVEPGRIEEVRERYELPPDYILTVGTQEPRKNLARLVRAWHSAASELPGVALAVVGGTGRAFANAEVGDSSRICSVGRLPDVDLAALYAGARMLAYVPLYEGFGLPPLEAMACGCPVLASAAGGVREAVGDCALMVDPSDEDEIADGILRLAGDEELRAALVARGARRAREHAWERTAQQVRQTLEMASEPP